jgi:hypothetical protein
VSRPLSINLHPVYRAVAITISSLLRVGYLAPNILLEQREESEDGRLRYLFHRNLPSLEWGDNSVRLELPRMRTDQLLNI